MSAPANLTRRSVWFTDAGWTDLRELMSQLGATSPSIAIALLVSKELQLQRAANGHSNSTCSQ
jgi:hypothetical protein